MGSVWRVVGQAGRAIEGEDIQQSQGLDRGTTDPDIPSPDLATAGDQGREEEAGEQVEDQVLPVQIPEEDITLVVDL